ncbi:MAG: prephenate dehydrogenase/arogenate dehydrogenase family protein [Candidatus Levybacteria bacterium]|nr:prephenate dehydrogenase/arogenate dehydrogenase family protein [Candidatus Levybacteria bacterium]
MKKISIVGFGRFGKVLYKFLEGDFIITIFNRSKVSDSNLTKNTTIAKDISQIYESDAVFYCVPISSFDQVIKSHKKYFRENQLLIDVLSVKLYPSKVFEKHLKNSKTQALLTHPMFGPDSVKNGFEGLPIIIDKFKASDENFRFWKNYFEGKKLKVIEMTAAEHDKLAAKSQGLTHFIGRLLESDHFKETPIDSLGAKKLLEVKEQTCNDTWQLFTDLQHYNPYTKHMRIKLGDVYDKLYNKLLPKQIHRKFLTFGIQGGRGSFNEEAVMHHIKYSNIKNYKIKYLYTSEKVLKALHVGEIDRGQFAIHNSVGGIVGESIEAMAKYKFKITEEFAIKISHALMIRKDADFLKVDIIMSHPQSLAQCKDTLSKKYPHLSQTSGQKELIDHAVVAKHLSQGKLPKNIATMGSKILAKIYDLKIIEDNLQDAKENYTSFLQVARI